MKTTLLRLLPFVALLFVSVRAADDAAIIAAVRAADDERTSAIIAADRARMEANFSDELYYAHSSGVIDTKASYIQSIVSRRTIYESFDYKDRKFTVAAPGVVLMTAHVFVKVKSGSTAPSNTNDLNILAVWRQENGKWRFLAWQSCKNPPADAAATKK
jgi:hypothetical protein